MATPNPCEPDQEFVLVLAGIEDLTTEIEDAFYNAGCGDALLGIHCGSAQLAFCRTAPTMGEAILSAIADVRKANVGAEVVRVDECNLVTAAEIARRIGRTRELVRQYITGKRGPGHFPPPACRIADRKPLWFWCEVAAWLHRNDMIREDNWRDAHAIAAINNLLEMRQLRQADPDFADKAMKAIVAD